MTLLLKNQNNNMSKILDLVPGLLVSETQTCYNRNSHLSALQTQLKAIVVRRLK